jgi:hypothetical protein
MARKKKKPKRDMTTEEVIATVFPKRVIRRVKQELGTALKPKTRPRPK